MPAQFFYTTPLSGTQLSILSSPDIAFTLTTLLLSTGGNPAPPLYDSCQRLPFPPIALNGSYSFELMGSTACGKQAQDSIPTSQIKVANQLWVFFKGANPGETIVIVLIDGVGGDQATHIPSGLEAGLLNRIFEAQLRGEKLLEQLIERGGASPTNSR